MKKVVIKAVGEKQAKELCKTLGKRWKAKVIDMEWCPTTVYEDGDEIEVSGAGKRTVNIYLWGSRGGARYIVANLLNIYPDDINEVSDYIHDLSREGKSNNDIRRIMGRY